MKILFISEYYHPKIMGGGEINLSTTAQALARKAVEVSVLTSCQPGLKKGELIKGVKVYRKLKTGNEPRGIINNLKRSLSFPLSIVREAGKLDCSVNFDAIHFVGTSLLAAGKLKGLKKPLFATIESYPALCPKGDRVYCGRGECKKVCSFPRFVRCQLNSSEIGKMKNKWYLKYNPLFFSYVYLHYRRLNQSLKFCRLIAISQYVQKLLWQQGQESTVIPNAIDLSLFETGKKDQGKRGKNNQTIASDKTSQTAGKTKILYLGSLTRFKGPHLLLEAARGLDCRLDFYGDGPLEEKLRRKIKEYGLDAEIHPNVPYDQVPEIYAGCDLVVFPSCWPEPFGRIPLEAAAAGKPTIGSDIAAIKETIPDKEFLVEAGKVSGFHQALKSFAEKPVKLDRQKSRRFVEENYSQERVAGKIASLYREELHKNER